jgi:hypothetical protein
MTRLVIDANLPSKLAGLTQPAEICDANGHVLGRYIPSCAIAENGPLISEEELDQREREAESYTTAEVLARLEKL